jgi:hypothetical protein
MIPVFQPGLAVCLAVRTKCSHTLRTGGRARLAEVSLLPALGFTDRHATRSFGDFGAVHGIFLPVPR